MYIIRVCFWRHTVFDQTTCRAFAVVSNHLSYRLLSCQGLCDSWTFRLCLSDEDYKHRVHIDVYLLTESSFSCRSFLDWATPCKLCSIVICVIVDCLLHQFLGSIQKWVRIPYQIHLITKLEVRWSTCVVACWLSHLLCAGWTIFVKRCHTISSTFFSSSAPTSRSFILSASRRENELHCQSSNMGAKCPLILFNNIAMPHALVNVLQQCLREYFWQHGALMATPCGWECIQRNCSWP